MIRLSTSRGQFNRLNQRERLRASQNLAQNEKETKKRKTEDPAKVFELVLLNIDDDWMRIIS